MATKILTWQQVSEWLEAHQDDPDRESIMRLAEAVETHVERALKNYRFDTVTRTDLAVDGTGTPDLIAPDAPITSLTAIKIGRDSTNPTATLDVTDADVVVYESSGLITRTDGGVFPRKRKYILLSYAAGWTKSTIPLDIRTCLQLLVAYLWRSRGREAVKNELLSGMLNWAGRAMEDTPGLSLMLGQYTRPTVASLF